MTPIVRWVIACLFAAGLSTTALAADPVKILRSDLGRIFSDARLADAQLGVEVLSLDRPELLYGKNPQKLFVPASNNKILTAAAALLCLGPDYRFKTRVWVDGTISHGVLKGDLIIQGLGDPSSSSRIPPKDPFLAFRDWAQKLKQRGITTISGDLIGDGGAFEEVEHGQGWAWDDLTEGYAAPVSALQFNENLIELEIAPGPNTGSSASIKASPLSDYAEVDNRVVTESGAPQPHIEIERSRGNETIVVRGVLPLKCAPLTRTVSVQFPIRYYLAALKSVLAQAGINVADCSIKPTRSSRPPSANLLWIQSSAPLPELMVPLMKMSLNLSSETLARVLGLELHGGGTFAKGKEAVQDALLRMGVNKDAYAYADGSGLSRLNLVSADTLIRILKFMYHSKHFACFYDALPIAGIDGTLASRLKIPEVANNVRAKTGSFTNVSALSGYVRTADNEMLAFSILVNNFLVSRDLVDSVQEKALARLAGFSRKGLGKVNKIQNSGVRILSSEF